MSMTPTFLGNIRKIEPKELPNCSIIPVHLLHRPISFKSLWQPCFFHLSPACLTESCSLAGFSIRAGGWRNSLAISCELAAYFPLENPPSFKSQNLMMSVFCSNTNFCSRMLEIFPGGMPPGSPLVTCHFGTRKLHLWQWVFSFSAYSKVFAIYLKTPR